MTKPRAALLAAIGLGCVGLLMLGLQPLILGGLLDEHRLDVTQLSVAATVELLALGAVAGALAGLVKFRHLLIWAVAGLVGLVGTNAACLVATGYAIVAWRAAAGGFGGVLVWIAVGLITQSARPGRLSGIFLVLQSVTQGGVALALPAIFGQKFNANDGFVALAAISAASLVAIPVLPRALPEMAAPEEGAGRINLAGALGLGAAFTFMAGIVGLFVFLDPLSHLAGVSLWVAQYAVAVVLGAQIFGGALAAWLDHRMPPGPALLGGTLAALAVVAMLAGHPGDALFLAAVALFGFLWIFTLPFYVPLLIRADPTRRAALLLAGAQLLGGGAGPLVTGAFATDANMHPALWADAGLFALCWGLTGLALTLARPR